MRSRLQVCRESSSDLEHKDRVLDASFDIKCLGRSLANLAKDRVLASSFDPNC
jgi:hypothetical protein